MNWSAFPTTTNQIIILIIFIQFSFNILLMNLVLGSDAAIKAADVVLMTDEPSKLVTAIKIARRTRGIVWQNTILAMG